MLGRLISCSVLTILLLPGRASAAIITFEGLSDLENVTTQVPGVTFTNATVLTSGLVNSFTGLNPCLQPPGSLNDFETPAHSLCNAAFDEGGPMRLDFAAPISAFSGFFTYFSPLSVEAFDASNASLGSVSSLFDANFVSTGNPANELLSLVFGGIRAVVITGDPNGSSFVVDDITYTARQAPEPGALALLGVTALILRRVFGRVPDRVRVG